MSKRVNNKKGKKFSPSRGSMIDKTINWSGFDFSNPTSKIDSNDVDRIVAKSVDSKPVTSKSSGRGRWDLNHQLKRLRF